MKPVERYVLATGFLGIAALVAAIAALRRLPVPEGIPDSPTWQAIVLFTILTFLGQVAYVRVRHGATTEELNFFEAAITAAILVLPANEVLFAGLLGMVLAEILIRRKLLKVAFNVGSWATAASLMLVVYYGLAAGSERFSLQAVLAMSAGGLVFAAWNLAALALLMQVNGGPSTGSTIRDEWPLSALIGVGGVAVGTTAVALSTVSVALLPYVLLPVLALWYAYGAAVQHAEARERSIWLVKLGATLAAQGQDRSELLESARAIQQIVGATEARILDPDDTAGSREPSAITVLSSLRGDSGPRALVADELPAGWKTGVATSLDLGTPVPGALLLGSTVPYRRSRFVGRTRGWSLAEADAPVLGALVAAVGSAMRAGAAFNALTEETAKLTAVVDNTSDGIAMIDDTDTIRLWSRTLERMTGVLSSDLVGHAADAAPLVVSTLLEASTAAQTASERRTVHVQLVRADGEELDVSLTTVWVRASITGRPDEEPGWVSILTVHDETRERRVERMKSEFVATVSHELRTPLTPIKGYAPWLAAHGDRVPLAKRTQALRVIADSADHLSRLVDDLLIASQVSEGSRLGVTIGVQDLREVVTQAIAGFPGLAGRITLDLPEGDVSIQCDRVRAVQCLSNLLQNAQKYTPEDSPLEVRAEVTGMHARIHVRDHGSGIPVEERERIFERFYRREDPFTMRTGGAGLGLNIARELAVAMGGGLVVQSPESGPGAEFVLHLATTDAPPVNAGQRSIATDSVPGYRADPRLAGRPPGPPTGPPGDATMDAPQAHRLAAR